MVQKKRKSKRLTSRQSHKLATRTKRSILAQKKAHKKTDKTVKIPPSVLRTPEDIKTYEAIKKGIQLRQELYKAQSETEYSQKTYMKHVNSVIEKSDVILQILDARDILGSRNEEVEKKVVFAGKKLVLIINKIDLVPRAVVNQWMLVLKKEFPVLVFHRDYSKDEIFNLLKNYCRSESGENRITVGIVGYPNVGKSTFINEMVRNKSCNTGSKAGITKEIQTISLEKNIKLLDCPGIIENSEINLLNVLRNAVDLDKVDVSRFVGEVLTYLNKEDLSLFYQIEEFNDFEDFLKLLGKKYGLIQKKGIINVTESAKRFLRDINNGKIAYYHVLEEKENEFTGKTTEGKLVFNFKIDE
ncbi:Guanine nucleotide-binding protein-like 3 [Conglomerata obtusa]